MNWIALKNSRKIVLQLNYTPWFFFLWNKKYAYTLFIQP